MSKFTHICKELRQESELTQQQLSSKLGISSSAIAMLEKGHREPTGSTLIAYANFFDVSLDFLMGRVEYESNTEKKINHQCSAAEKNRPEQIKPPESDIQLIYDALNPRQQVKLLAYAEGLLAANDLTPNDLK